MVEDLPTIQRWLNRILAFPIHLQNAIFDEYLGLVEARVDAARAAGTLDLGVETVAVESFEVLGDRLLRTDPGSGATTHLLEVEIARALRPMPIERLSGFHDLANPRNRPMCNSRSGRVALLVPARRLLSDDGERIERFELIRPLKREYLTPDQLEESNWEVVERKVFVRGWQAEVLAANGTLKRERLHLATGLLLPIWDKLPGDYVRVSRIAASDGRSLLGREVPGIHVPDLAKALGIDIALDIGADELAGLVVKSGKAMPLTSVEPLVVKRALVNANQRIELTGWSPARLDWYKAQGCFTEIIRYRTRLFVPVSEAAAILARLRR